MRSAPAAAVALLLGCGATGAHEGATTAYARIVISGSTVRYSLTLADASRLGPAAQDPAALAQAVRAKVRLANDGGPCASTPAEVVPPAMSSTGATVVVDFACRGAVRSLAIRDDLPDALGAELHTLAKVEWPGGTAQFAFAAEARDARFEIAAGQPAAGGVGSSFWLGVEHIPTGYDHLLFLLVLVLALGGGGAWALVKIITLRRARRVRRVS
jgi:hypothetical protein